MWISNPPVGQEHGWSRESWYTMVYVGLYLLEHVEVLDDQKYFSWTRMENCCLCIEYRTWILLSGLLKPLTLHNHIFKLAMINQVLGGNRR